MNAFKSILVHLDASSDAAARLSLADLLARRDGGEATALYAVTPAALVYPMGFGPDADTASVMLDLESGWRRRARQQFDAAVAAGATSLRWSELGAAESLDQLVERALCADLLVLGQGRSGLDAPSDLPADFVEWAVIASGKPVLVVPYIAVTATLPDCVLVAWKPTRESARALAASLPLLQSAARVHVAAWADNGTPPAQAHAPVIDYLRRHGVQAQLHACGPPTGELGELLLSLANDLAADLLVMGCYGHTRAREWVLGGVSRTVLRSMSLPVLMAH